MKGKTVNIKLSLRLFVLLAFTLIAGCSGSEQAKDEDSDSIKQEQNKTVTDSGAVSREDVSVQTEPDSLKYPKVKIRNPDDPFVTLETDLGKMTLELYRDIAPAHCDSFVARTKEGFYDGLIFHRVWRNFMIQGGCPKGDGTGNAGYFLKAEFSDLPHLEGTLSMARGRDPNSASSQFFICLARNRATENLDGKYTVFGRLLKGYETLHAIGDVKCTTNPNNPRENTRPIKDVHIIKAYLSDPDGNPL